MDQYNVTGMSCAACSARVEKAVSKVPGVESVAVSLLTNSMGVEGSASQSDIIKAVTDAGYNASPKGAGSAGMAAGAAVGGDDDILIDRETPKLIRRLVTSLVFLAILMYYSMGHMMFGLKLPSFCVDNPVAVGLTELLLALIVMIINNSFFINGFRGLVHRAPNMDTLVALGSSAAFLYSLFALYAMTDAQTNAGTDVAMMWMDEFYFESAAMIVTLITVGKTLEAYSKGRTTDALKGLVRLTPKTAVVIRDGEEQQIPVEQVRIGDVFLVRPGEQIPVDGTVIKGGSAVDESALTGESVPVDKAEGMAVYAATINMSGMLECRADKVGQDTALSKIIQLVTDAAATKAPAAKAADKVAGVFVPAVMIIALVTTVVWILLFQPLGYALARGISVLVISCPCALGLATPVAIMVGNGMGAKNGMLFKTALSLEEAGRIEIVALDKTGTITIGQPLVTDIIPLEVVGVADAAETGATGTAATGAGAAGTDAAAVKLLETAAALEYGSEHPLGRAVTKYYDEACPGRLKEIASAISDFKILPGNGLEASYEGGAICGGSMKFIASRAEVTAAVEEEAEKIAIQGKTPLLFAKDGRVLGIIAVADVIRDDSRQAVSELRNMGIQVVMLTGDNEKTARAIGEEAGVDQVIAGVLPEGKEAVIRRLQQQGKTAMVGDGINDAPALTRADLGIAIGAGTDIAIDAADIVLMKNQLRDVPAAIRLSRATLRNIHQNLFWAFIYNIIRIPLAAGVYIKLLGWELNPMFGAAAMSLSSFCVVTNALRLNLFKVYDASRDKQIKKKEHMEVDLMEKKMSIEGMMCMHCEANVKKALEAIDGVESAAPDHEKNIAIVKLSADVADEVLKKAVEDKDYKVTGIE